MVSEPVILLSCEGIQAWLWKTIKTMQVTIEHMVQRGNRQGIKDNKRKARSLEIV